MTNYFQADSTEDFVETWLYAIDEDDPFCVEACGDKIVPPSCPVNTVDKAKDYCMPLKEEDGRFAVGIVPRDSLTQHQCTPRNALSKSLLQATLTTWSST